MKRLKMTMLALAGALVMSACGESKKDKTVDDASMPMQNEMHQEGETTMSENLDDGKTGEVEFKDEKVTAVYDQYSDLKTALVNTDAEEAQTAAKKLTEKLAEVNDNSSALAAAQTIAGTSNINEQRTAFLELSAAMEEMMSGALASGELYKQYCPMAFDGKGGAWLSASKEIRNPYYGDKMLKCGSVQATIQ